MISQHNRQKDAFATSCRRVSLLEIVLILLTSWLSTAWGCDRPAALDRLLCLIPCMQHAFGRDHDRCTC